MKANNRIIAISDIHGCYEQFIALLDGVNYNGKDDKLILLGDYIDRGNDSYNVVKKIQEMQKLYGNNVIALRGNHEQLLIDNELSDWYMNGGRDTIKSYRVNGADYKEDFNWFSNLPYYYEHDNYIFVHAYMNPYQPLEVQDKYNMLWLRKYYQYYDTKRSIVFGHTPTCNICSSNNEIVKINQSYAIDTACVYGGNLTALIINPNNEVEAYHVEGYQEEINYIEDRIIN